MADQPGPTYIELMRRIHGTNIYAEFIPVLAEDRQGWNSDQPAFEEIIRNLRPDIVIDVGVWKGASTILLANLLKRHGGDRAQMPGYTGSTSISSIISSVSWSAIN